MRDIVDEIDALVDEQLAVRESTGGYETIAAAMNPDPGYPGCPHCGRHWHGLPVTERIAAMYRLGQFDEDYRVDTDESPVLCHGSEFIGPMPAPSADVENPPPWIEQLIRMTTDYVAESMEMLFGIPAAVFGDSGSRAWQSSQQRWWRYQTSLGAAADAASRDIGTNFHRYTGGPALATWDYFGDAPPDTGHTWEPLTAPGVATHPSAGLTRVGPNPWDFEYTPEVGQLINVVTPQGTFTERITHHSRDEETGEMRVTVGAPSTRRDRSGFDSSRFLAGLLGDADLSVHLDLWHGHDGAEYVENRLLPMRLEDV